ncbi:MAG: N-acetylmuramoyl-L-alanine amidase CwlD [Bacillaceae bacterium]
MAKLIRFIIICCVCFFSYDVAYAQPFGLPLSGKIIVIDPGHGGIDGGATRGNITEKDITLIISKMLRDYLQPQGAIVILTREGDYDLAEKSGKQRVARRKSVDLSRRVGLVNQYKPNLFISIHLNAITQTSSRGAQTFYYDSLPANKKFAVAIQKELIGCLQNTNRLARTINHVYLLKNIKVTGALVEVGFVSNPSERALLGQTEYQRKIAVSIYRGVLRYLSKPSK